MQKFYEFKTFWLVVNILSLNKSELVFYPATKWQQLHVKKRINFKD